jgi:UPF0271 protein
MHRIDLNCDLGEGAGHDAELMPCITSANIACGGHAGDAASMRAAVDLAVRHGVAPGAHPGLNDREGFGRREQALTAAEAYDLVAAQVWALQQVAQAAGVRLAHVKPHGALYNLAARDAALAQAVAAAVHEADPQLVLIGLAGSRLPAAGHACGLRVAREVFADRNYEPDGSLTPRSRPGAVITDETVAAARVLRMVREGRVRASDGFDLDITADTVCIHGDGPRAVALAQGLNAALRQAGVVLLAFGAAGRPEAAR